MTYEQLLYREQQDIKLLSDMIDKGLPVESYIHLVKYKLNQLTKELQEFNKAYIESFRPKFVSGEFKNTGIGHLACSPKEEE